jgi:hypothetical protein
MGSDQTATFEVALEGNADEFSDQTAASIERMRESVLGSEKSIKQLSETLRKLKGSSAEVKEAKAQLTAKLNGERDAISRLTAGAVKAGVPLELLSTKTKVTAKETTGMGDAIDAAGGPVASLRSKLGVLGKVMGDGSVATGVFRLAVVGAIAAVAALVVGSVMLLAKFSQFVVEGANAARTANLFREAATGSAANAKALGEQVDALAGKVSTSKTELNELAMGLAKNGVQGQTLVDTFNAVGQAADAMGAEAGNKIRGLVEAGRLSQRLFLNRESLVGTGVAFDEVAKQLAESMKIGVNDAKAALAEGRVGLGVGAKALRDTIEKKFGEINARKMLDINVQAAKFREKLANLTSGVNLEPFLKGLDKMLGLFDEGTVAGSALKTIVTRFGNGLGEIFGKGTDVGSKFFKALVIGGLTLVVAVLKVKKAFGEAFKGKDVLGDVDLLETSLSAITGVAEILGFAIEGMGTVLIWVAGVVGDVVASVEALGAAFDAGYQKLASLTWGDIGEAMIDGLVLGILGGSTKVRDAILGIARDAKNTFKSALGINSPSTVFAGFGQNTAEGYAQGVERAAPATQEAVDKMAPSAPSGGGGGSKGGGGMQPVTLQVNITVAGGGDAKASVSPSARAELIQAFREMALAAGIPVT